MSAPAPWRESVKVAATNPLTYVLGFSVLGAALITAGVAVLIGAGPALIAAGIFMMAGAVFITRGMSNG